MGWLTRNVTVNFIDDATGAIFATTKTPPTDLPETFEIETTCRATPDMQSARRIYASQ